MSSDLILRPYQIEGREWLTSHPRSLLADEPGLGKTVQALSVIDDRPTLVVAQPEPALGVWHYEAAHWYHHETLTYTGNKAQRDSVWDQYRQKGGVLVVNYHNAPEILERNVGRGQVRWGTIIYDECQALRNRKAATLFKTFKRFRSDRLHLLSGTPVVNGAQDVWTYLHLIDPQKFRGFWDFAHAYFNTFWDDTLKREEITGVRDAEALRKLMEPYMLRRRKADHLAELPDKIRQTVPIAMTPYQRGLYDQFAEEMMAEVGDHIVLTPSILAKITRLRQTLVTPALYDGENISAGLDAVRDLVESETADGRACAIFTCFAQAIPYIKAALKGVIRQASMYSVQGGMGDKAYAQVQAFQNDTHPPVLIASVQSAAAWTATRAKTAIFLGADWTPMRNIQAEDRLHRQGQTDVVRALYLTNEGTFDQHILDILDKKTTWAALALDPHNLTYPDRYGRLTKAKFIPEGEDWLEWTQ